jgi:acyl-CoA synthetase (AMP-forming)/AMP-acid ligase II
LDIVAGARKPSRNNQYPAAGGSVVSGMLTIWRYAATARLIADDSFPAHCKRFLANYKIPRRIEFSDAELPKSGTGKILKRILRERFWVHEARAVG